jgi:phosphodiesterase/alkaline phosphatase D-like protein
VLNTHQTKPFHVMLGGGDQIYNDAVMRQTTLFQEWLAIKNPLRKHEAAFTPDMQDELQTFYLDRYSMWFSQGLFGMANSQIPMVNLWDDHGTFSRIPRCNDSPDSVMQEPLSFDCTDWAHREQ